MGFKCGIVGLPNVGKSTLFNALTKSQVSAANFPFCTIEPNVGTVPVPDSRLKQLAQIVQPKRTLPTYMQFVDIAGLVKGASKGEGLGNQFLATIRETDAIAQVVRCFQSNDIVHVAGKVNPIADLETVQLELILADLTVAERAVLRLQKKAKAGDLHTKTAVQILTELVLPVLNAGKPLRSQAWDLEAQRIVEPFQFLTLKPKMLIANVDEETLLEPEKIADLQILAEQEQVPLIAVCATLEAELAHLNDAKSAEEYLRTLNVTGSGLERLICTGYQLLQLHSFFTAGVTEVRAWTIPTGTTAAQAAGKIHSDFEKGFIRAEVVAYEDFITYGGEQGAKAAAKWRLEGKDYIVQDGDVIHFRFNV